MRGTIKNSGCVNKSFYRDIQASKKNKSGYEYIRTEDGTIYEYRSDYEIYKSGFGWNGLKRVKKAEWLAIKAQHEEGNR